MFMMERLNYAAMRALHNLLIGEIMYQSDSATANADFKDDLEKLRQALRAVMRYF